MGRRRAAALLIIALFGAGCSGDTATASADRGASAAVAEGGIGNPSSPDGVEPAALPTPTATPPPPTPTPEGPRALRVVSLMGESGVMAPLDRPALAGVVAAVGRLNDSGGIDGQLLELERIDTDSRLSIAERLAERLLRNPPDLLIVTCDVEFSKPILEFADENGFITISPCADDLGYSTAAWGTRNFALGAPAEPRGALAAQAAFSRYGPTVMVLRDRTSPEALRFCNGFERAFRELGGTVVYRDEFNYDTPEPLLDRIKERGRPTDSIVLCSHVPGGNDAAPSLIEQLRLLGFEAPIVAGETLDEPTWFQNAPLLGELTYVSWSSIYGNDPDDEVNDLIARANETAAGSEDPLTAGVSTVLGADAIELWARAVEAVRSAEPSRVAAAMSSFDNEPFMTGSISFVGGSRLDVSRTYRVIRVSGGSVDEPEIATVDG